MSKTKVKVHYCFNCGAETDNREELPNHRDVYVCHETECQKEHRWQCQALAAEIRDDAREDGYSRYY